MSDNAQQLLLQEIALLLEPLIEAASSNERRRDVFGAIGWNIEAIPGLSAALITQLGVLKNSYEAIRHWVDEPPETIPELVAALRDADQIFQLIEQFDALARDAAG